VSRHIPVSLSDWRRCAWLGNPRARLGSCDRGAVRKPISGHLLGRLYGPEDGKTFEGVIGKNLSNPIPAWAEHGADRKVVHTRLRRTWTRRIRIRARSGTTRTRSSTTCSTSTTDS